MTAKKQIKTQLKAVLLAATGLAMLPLHAAEQGYQEVPVTGNFTPKLFVFDKNTPYLERYNYQKGSDGGNRLDFDLNLVANDGRRDVFALEREGFGADNYRGNFRLASDTLGFTGYFTQFRTSTHGLNFLYSPGGGVPGGTDPCYFSAITGPCTLNTSTNANTGYLAQFNNDSPGATKFHVDRATFGMSLAMKPELLGDKTFAKLDYDSYKRDGNRFATWILGNGDVNTPAAGATRVLQRWRGFDKPIDEKMNRFTFGMNGEYGGFTLAYEGSLEKFENKAKDYAVEDFAANILAAGTANLDPAAYTRSVHFIPDTTQLSNNFRLARNYGTTAVAAGYGLMVLTQDSFSQEQQDAGFDTGKITTSSAYVNVSSAAVSGVGIEGFVKYNNRKNGSTFPAVGLLDPAQGEMLTVRINELTALNYGLAATVRPDFWRSSVTLGWRAEDKDRDLTWSDVVTSPVGSTVGSVQPWESLYKGKTSSNEVYVNWNARPAQGMLLRVTPAYTKASKTGMVSEPEKAVSLKSKLSYTSIDGMMVSGYFNRRNASNTGHAFTNSLANNVMGTVSTNQDIDRTQQSAGVSISMPFGAKVNTNASLSLLKDDFSSYLLRSDRRRYLNLADTLNFANAGRSNYDINTQVLALGGDWQVSDPMRLNAGYTVTKSKGDTASGYIYDQLSANNSIDGTIDSSVQTLSLGVDYEVNKSTKLKGSFVRDSYTDNSYAALTGDTSTVMAGVTIGF